MKFCSGWIDKFLGYDDSGVVVLWVLYGGVLELGMVMMCELCERIYDSDVIGCMF